MSCDSLWDFDTASRATGQAHPEVTALFEEFEHSATPIVAAVSRLRLAEAFGGDLEVARLAMLQSESRCVRCGAALSLAQQWQAGASRAPRRLARALAEVAELSPGTRLIDTRVHGDFAFGTLTKETRHPEVDPVVPFLESSAPGAYRITLGPRLSWACGNNADRVSYFVREQEQWALACALYSGEGIRAF